MEMAPRSDRRVLLPTISALLLLWPATASGAQLAGGPWADRGEFAITPRILAGERTADLLLATSGVRHAFAGYRRWGFGPDVAVVREGGSAVDRRHSIQDHFESFFWVVGAAFALQTILIGALLITIVRRRQAERERRLYAEIVAAAGDLMAYLDRDHVYRAANEAYLHAHGRSRQEIIGRKAVEVLGEEFFAGTVEPYLRRCLRGEVVGYESWYDYPGLGRRCAVVNYYPALDKGGDVVGVVVSARDITEQKRAEDALRESEQRFRRVVNQAGDAVVVTNRAGGIVEANPEACRSLGYTREELLALKVTDVDPDLETIEEYRRSLAQIRSDRPITIQSRNQRKDGSIFPVEVRITPLEDKPEPLYLAVVRDVSEREQTAEELAQARSLLLAAIEHTPAGILIADAPDVNIRLANTAALGIRGPSEGPLTDIPAELHPVRWQVFHPDGTPFAPEELPLSRAILEGVTVRNVEAIIRRPDGEERQVLANAAPVRDAEGHVVAGVVVFPDITEVRRAEEQQRRLEVQIQHAQKLESLGILAGGIAHDFNNLLVAVLGHAELALADMSPVAPERESVEEIAKAAKRAAELTNQMLAYSGKGRFVVKHVDLNEIVDEMGHLLRASIAKSVSLRYELALDLPPAEVDVAQLRQVVMNLVTNASEAVGDQPGVITIATGLVEASKAYLAGSYLDEDLPAGSYVYLEVTDTGCGMDEETRAKLFDPFFTTKFSGRGLGLAAVLGIVRGHGGAIMVVSQPEAGTSIRILLPSAVGPVEVLSPTSETAAADWRGSGTILVVDDEESVRSTARLILERRGFAVLTARNGQAALRKLTERQNDIALVLLDMTMPRMSGEETFHELRALAPDLKVVLTSGYNEQEATNRFAGQGLAGFIQKPFTVEKLIATLRSVLES